MATQPSTSTGIHSEKSPTVLGETPALLLLELATKHLQQAQELTSGDVRMRLQFNHGQCRYLVKKLETAVQCARDSMSLSSSKQVSVSMEDWKFMGKWKFLVRLAMDVESFVQECCKKEYWIQAACMLMNAFEYVASLSCDLDLCIWSFEATGRIMLETALRRKLDSISKAQDRRLLDHVDLMEKVEGALQNLESISTPEEHQHAISLFAALPNILVIPDHPDLVLLSLRDQVELLLKVEAALSSDTISNPEERQLATGLAERFLVSVADPVSDIAHIDFMGVEAENLEREEMLGKGSFGDVYKVKWLGTPAAEKTLRLEENGGNLQADFVKEVSILARQSHPNIVRLLCYVKGGVKCSIVQELMCKDLTKLI